MITLTWCLAALAGVLLLIGAVMDVRWRALPMMLPVAILCCGVAFFALQLPVIWAGMLSHPTVLFAVILLCGLLAVAYGLGLIGLSDLLVGSSIMLVVLGFDGSRRILLTVIALSGTGTACCFWILLRVERSLSFSGTPRTSWDVLALFKGRIEKEPHLRQYPSKGRRCRKGRLQENNEALARLESSRTPDGLHLYRDPCPLMACYFVGYLALLLGVLKMGAG